MFIERLVRLRRFRLAREVLLLYGISIPARVQVGSHLQMVHRGMGTVIHPATVIGSRVRIYPQVTIGRLDGHLPPEHSSMERVEIGDDVVLFPGSRILGGPGVTRVGAGTLVGANAVLRQSTGEREVWAGIPARKIRDLTSEEIAALPHLGSPGR